MTRILSSNESQAIRRSCLFVSRGRNAPCVGAQTTKPFESPPPISCYDSLQRCKISVHAFCPLDPIGTVPDTPRRASMFSHHLSRPMCLGRARTIVARIHRPHRDVFFVFSRTSWMVSISSPMRCVDAQCFHPLPSAHAYFIGQMVHGLHRLVPFPSTPSLGKIDECRTRHVFLFVRSIHRRFLGYLDLFAWTTCLVRPSLLHNGPRSSSFVSPGVGFFSPPGLGRGGHQPQERTHDCTSLCGVVVLDLEETSAQHHRPEGMATTTTTTFATTPNAAAALDQFSRKLRRRCVDTHTSSERRTTPRGRGKPGRDTNDAKQACCCLVMQPARETKGVRRWEPKD